MRAGKGTRRQVEPIQPEELSNQVEGLAGDLREQAGLVAGQVDDVLTPQEWASAGTVYLTGDGDSYHASCASEMAFESIGGAACEPLSALRFLEYAAPWLGSAGPGRPLVIAVSASGRTERVAQAVAAARERGALTVAVTSRAGGPVIEAADRSVVIQLPDLRPSPGIRTYQASLLALLLTAIRLGEARGRHGAREAGLLREELAGLADGIEATAAAIKGRCRETAELIADSPVLAFTGSGPSYGTAQFGAAKMAEAAGVFASAQDLEEWCHVECHAYPDDLPVFVIAPPGRSHWRARGLAAAASSRGRRVIAVTHRDDQEISAHACIVLPVSGDAREEFSPMLYHVFAGYVAGHLARQLERFPFQGGRRPRPQAGTGGVVRPA
jgi:glutamine---fructose-6-phosphate transaminase (isomerizing)